MWATSSPSQLPTGSITPRRGIGTGWRFATTWKGPQPAARPTALARSLHAGATSHIRAPTGAIRTPFSLAQPATYWAHPHTGLDTDYGLYLPVIVDHPTEPSAYDAQWIVMLDDWTDGIGKSPQEIHDDLRGRRGMGGMPGMGGMGGMSGVGRSDLLGGDAGDVSYPYYLINGRIPAAPTTFSAKPGQRIRIRIINAGSDTAFRVALAGHTMTVTHTDGYPVVPTEVDALLVGMGERYDVIVTAADGVFPLVAVAEGKNAVARALLSTGAGNPPSPAFQPAELSKRVGTVDMFTATPEV